MHVVCILFAALAAAASSAATSISARTSGLFLRQVDPSQYPPQCQSTCSNILDTINACTTVACMCTASNNQALASCVDCILGSDGTDPSSSLVAQAQSILDNFESTCAQGGSPVATLQVTPSYVSGASQTTITSGASQTTIASSSSSIPQITFVGTSTHSSESAINTVTSPAAGTNTGTALGSSTTSSDINPFAKSGSMKVGVPVVVAVAGVVFGGFALLL